MRPRHAMPGKAGLMVIAYCLIKREGDGLVS